MCVYARCVPCVSVLSLGVICVLCVTAIDVCSRWVVCVCVWYVWVCDVSLCYVDVNGVCVLSRWYVCGMRVSSIARSVCSMCVIGHCVVCDICGMVVVSVRRVQRVWFLCGVRVLCWV